MPDSITPESPDELFSENPLAGLDSLIHIAKSRGAAKLLVLAGKPILCRINGQLSEPIVAGRVHFNHTQRLVSAMLSPQQHAILDTDGAVEIDYTPTVQSAADGHSNATLRINIFFGDGAHNLIVFLEP